MSLDDLNVTEFLNIYKNKLKAEKERLESYTDITKNNENESPVLPEENKEAVNNIKRTSNNNATVTTNQHCEKKKPASSGIENISMLRKETNVKHNNGNDLTEESLFGFGEYEKRRQKYLEERRLDYKEYLEKQKQNCLLNTNKNWGKRDTRNKSRNFAEDIYSPNVNLITNLKCLQETKSVQTDIPDNYLPKSNVQPSNISDINTSVSENNSDKEYSDMTTDAPRPNQLAVKIDKVQIGTQNIIVPGYRGSSYDSGYLRDTSPKARYLADLKHTYFPSFTKANENPIDNEEYLSKKLKWEKARQHEEYHEELRKQIEEKQRIAMEIAERERYQEAALTRRVERQLQQLRMEQEDEKAKQALEENYHRYAESKWNRPKNYQKSRDVYNYSSHPFDYKVNEFYQPYKTQSENSLINKSSNKVPYSFNIPENSIFSTGSTSKLNKETLKENRYVEEPIKPTNFKRDLNANRRSDKSKHVLDDSFSVPILRATSPTADNLKYSTNVKESNTPNSPAMQQVEAKWMIPAVQKNIVKRNNLPSIGESKNVLTQLGAIRLQLQQEQLRLNQTLKNKVTKNTK